MFGLSWAQIGIILLVGAFVLGPERVPTAVSFVAKNLQRARSLAAGAQSDLRREIGPEIDELRRQVADLRSLTKIQGLRDLQDLHPKHLLSKNLFRDVPSEQATGPLGLTDPPKISNVDVQNSPPMLSPAQCRNRRSNPHDQVPVTLSPSMILPIDLLPVYPPRLTMKGHELVRVKGLAQVAGRVMTIRLASNDRASARAEGAQCFRESIATPTRTMPSNQSSKSGAVSRTLHGITRPACQRCSPVRGYSAGSNIRPCHQLPPADLLTRSRSRLRDAVAA